MSITGRIYLAAALILFSSSCVAATAELSWVGCDISKAAYVSDLADMFQQQTGTNIELRTGNSSSGIRDVVTGKADIGSSTRYLLPGDTRETGIELVPVAWDALTIIVHKDNPVKNISLDQLRAIYTGKITNWSRLGGNDHEIEVLIHQQDNSAAGSTLREILFSDAGKKISASRTIDSSVPLETVLQENPHAIAITGISSAHQHDVRIISLDNVTPTIENIKSGDYSLYRTLYLSYNPNSSKLESIKSFISYINSKSGRDLMRANGVVPYREAMRLIMKKVYENEASYPLTVDKS